MECSIKEAGEKLKISEYTLRYYDKEGLTPYLKKKGNVFRMDNYAYKFKEYPYAN